MQVCLNLAYIVFKKNGQVQGSVWRLSLSAQGRVNSLDPGRLELNFRHVIFKQILFRWLMAEVPCIWVLWSCAQVLDLIDDKSTLVQAMGFCHQVTSHYLNQCWPSAMSSYGITRPQWIDNARCSLLLIDSVRLFFLLSKKTPKYLVELLNHVKTWHVLLQLSCQIWT